MGQGKYVRSPERGFRKIAMAFWKQPRTGLIYGSMDMDVSKAKVFQEQVKGKFGVRPSMGHMLGKAIALSLKNTPEGNGKIIWGQAYLKDTVDVYFQVDMADGKDLSGVVVPDTANKTIVEVATILRDRAERLRKGQDEQYEKTQKGCVGKLPSWAIKRLLGFLTFLEYNLGITPTFLGAKKEPFGTVMVTNVSSFNIDQAYAPLVPVSRVPFVALMGQVKDRPWVDENGELCVRPILTGSATLDHRMLDGNKIGRVIRLVRRYMGNPFLYEAEALGLEDPFEADPLIAWERRKDEWRLRGEDGPPPREPKPESTKPAEAKTEPEAKTADSESAAPASEAAEAKETP